MDISITSKFPPALFFFPALFIYYYNFVIRTLNVRPNPLAKFQEHNTVFLPMGTMLYSRIAKP